MDFCHTCKKIMHPKDGKLICLSCGFVKEGKIESSEKMSHEEKGEGVVDDVNIFADYDFHCDKCGYDKAQIIERQAEISDEDNILMFKCGKCGKVKDATRKRL